MAEAEKADNGIANVEKIRKKNPKSVLIGYININSIRNKLVNLVSICSDNFDILAVAETKIDASFPNSQFYVKGYKMPHRLDVSEFSGGILVYIRDWLPSARLNSFTLPQDIQIVPIKLNLLKAKWLTIFIYRPPKQNLSYFLSYLEKIIDFYNYERVLLVGDFNSEPDKEPLASFITSYMLYCHIRFKTCWKSDKGSCIDLILSNQKNSFQRNFFFGHWHQ